jgi:hypothetical protein
MQLTNSQIIAKTRRRHMWRWVSLAKRMPDWVSLEKQMELRPPKGWRMYGWFGPEWGHGSTIVYCNRHGAFATFVNGVRSPFTWQKIV